MEQKRASGCLHTSLLPCRCSHPNLGLARAAKDELELWRQGDLGQFGQSENILKKKILQ